MLGGVNVEGEEVEDLVVILQIVCLSYSKRRR